MKNSIFLTTLFAVLTFAAGAFAQGTTFTYQGKLTDSSLPANGTYDFQFILLTASPQVQVGPTLLRPATVVTNGVFTVQLDFTISPINPFLSGSDMVLQIGVKKPTDAGFTILTPNQPIASVPYAIRSAASSAADIATNSQNLGGVAAAQYVLTTDAKMTDARTPLAGSNNYVQNQNSSQQFGNFAINGTGFANIFNAASQYNILSSRVLTADSIDNTFVGFGTGLSNTGGGVHNTFVGNFAGPLNTTGSWNTFTGSQAGAANTTGSSNSFFGQVAGQHNTTGAQNSFFGMNAGSINTNGGQNAFFGFSSGANNNSDENSFFGFESGLSNTNGFQNSFFGSEAGLSNTTGSGNSFFGHQAGELTVTGNNNSFFGDRTGQQNTTGHNNDFYGSGAGVANTTGSSNSFFGSNAGSANTTSSQNSFFGASAGASNTDGAANAFLGNLAGFSNTTGGQNTFLGQNSGFSNTTASGNTFLGQSAGANSSTGSSNTFVGANAGISLANTGNENGNTMIGSQTGYASGVTNATAIGRGAVANASNTINLGKSTDTTIVGFLQLTNIGGAGSTGLCVNNSPPILVSVCASSLRYKKDLSPFTGGLDMVKRFRPITFSWKDGGMRDLGLGAEDVEKIDPLLVNYNKNGDVQGVKYDRISIVLLNAMKEQQAQIETQAAQIRRQQIAIDGLRKALCANKRSLNSCKTSR